MSDSTLTQRIDTEKISDNVDVDELVEGTQWEDEIDGDKPLGEALGGQIGAILGRAIGESLGRTIGDMVVDELLSSSAGEHAQADEEPADTVDEATDEEPTAEEAEAAGDGEGEAERDGDESEAGAATEPESEGDAETGTEAEASADEEPDQASEAEE